MPLSDTQKKEILDLFDIDKSDLNKEEQDDLTEKVMESSLSEVSLKGFIEKYMENPKMHTKPTGEKAGSTSNSATNAWYAKLAAKKAAEEALEKAKKAQKLAKNADKAAAAEHVAILQQAVEDLEKGWKKYGGARPRNTKKARRGTRKGTRRGKKMFFGLF